MRAGNLCQSCAENPNFVTQETPMQQVQLATAQGCSISCCNAWMLVPI